MLGDDTDLDDAALAVETAAAMRELASIVTDAPPLRLAPHRGTDPSRRRVRRPWAAWITPLAAAAAVIMLAITLVAVRSNPNGPVVPATKPTPASDSVPAYYAELVQEPGNAENPDQIQVRNTLTGKLVAAVNPASGSHVRGHHRRRRRPHVRRGHPARRDPGPELRPVQAVRPAPDLVPAAAVPRVGAARLPDPAEDPADPRGQRRDGDIAVPRRHQARRCLPDSGVGNQPDRIDDAAGLLAAVRRGAALVDRAVRQGPVPISPGHGSF